jgi:hypothetical protein
MFRTMIWHQRSLSIMYGILSLINSNLLTADMALLCWGEKNLYLIHDSHSSSHRKKYIHLFESVPPLFHLTSCTPIKSNLYFDSSFVAVISIPALYRHLTFHVPNHISILFWHLLGHLSKESGQVRGPLRHFVTSLFFTVKSC